MEFLQLRVIKDFLKKGFLLYAGFFCIVLSVYCDTLLSDVLDRNVKENVIQQTQNYVKEKCDSSTQILKRISSKSPSQIISETNEWIQKANEEGLMLFVYEDGKLLLWTSNVIFPTDISEDGKVSLKKLDNGYYIQQSLRIGGIASVCLIPVKYNYTYQNIYLKNVFTPSPNRLLEFGISETKSGFSTPISYKDSKHLFYLTIEGEHLSHNYIIWLFILGWLLLFIFFHKVVTSSFRKGNYLLALLGYGMNTLPLLYALIFKEGRFPKCVFESEVFNPQVYATSNFLSSFGDLLLLYLLIGWSFWLFLKLLTSVAVGKKGLKVKLIFVLCFSLSGGLFLERLLESMINDSNISFSPENIFSLNQFSYVGFLILFSLYGLLFIFIQKFLDRLRIKKLSSSYFYLILFLIYGLAELINGILGYAYHTSIALSFCFALVLWNTGKTRIFKYERKVYFVILSSVFLSIMIGEEVALKRLETQHVLASRLVSERDAQAEYLYGNVYKQVMDDSYVKSYFSNPIITQSFLVKRINQLYFSGYFSKYDVEVSTFSSEGLPYRGNYDLEPLSYYKNQIITHATPARDTLLFYINTNTGLPSYISIIPVLRDGRVTGNILLRFGQKAFFEESIYPELLLNDKVQRNKEIEAYSFAIYNNFRLTTQKGNFSYPGLTDLKFRSDNPYKQFQNNGYNHLAYQLNPGIIVVVSHYKQGFLDYIASFSFIMVLCGMFTLIADLTGFTEIGLGRKRRNIITGIFTLRLRNLQFKARIFTSILLSMSLALFLIGFVTIKYISYQFNNDEIANLKKKTKSLSLKLESRFDNENSMVPTAEEDLEGAVKELSQTYQTDINVFDIEGNMLASSQNLIYESQVIEPKMHPIAFNGLHSLFASEIIQEEAIGGLKYTAAYIPIRNSFGQTTAYLNLPYFSKEKELNDKISNFLVALINLYLLLFIILLAIGVFISNTLISPLNIIRKHLRAIGLGKPNELITWQTNDEIGKLVNEYNTMILALEESATKLAQSEREGAWREMAKQVAHEIKNPLTPMKLNLQQLQRAWLEKSERLPEVFEKVTSLIIKQIDSLSQIATEFSAFATMPIGEPEIVEVNHVLTEISELFQNSNCKIETKLAESGGLVYIDKNQFSRAVQNLVKNATQAIPENKQGLVSIHSYIEEELMKIEITDNGTGISAETQEKIFLPNFSTKTAGMGLGLAIVKNIISKAGGDVWFKTEAGVGTSFFILLPLHSNE